MQYKPRPNFPLIVLVFSQIKCSVPFSANPPSPHCPPEPFTVRLSALWSQNLSSSSLNFAVLVTLLSRETSNAGVGASNFRLTCESCMDYLGLPRQKWFLHYYGEILVSTERLPLTEILAYTHSNGRYRRSLLCYSLSDSEDSKLTFSGRRNLDPFPQSNNSERLHSVSE